MWLRRNASKRPKMSEMEVWNSIGAVRLLGPKNHANEVLPPGVAAHFKKLAPGIYKYGYGPKRGASFVKFSTPSLRGAMTSTRIGASKVGEYHWLVDNYDPSHPVVIRGIDDRGHTFFRVEEYARQFAKAPAHAMVKRASKRTSR